MDEQDLKIKEALQEKIELPSKYTNMVQKTLQNSKKLRKYSIREAIYRLLIGGLATILGMSGVCFASVKIYNEYCEHIKKQEEVRSRGLFDDGSGITTYDTDLTQNDMIWDDECKMRYKIIRDFSDYTKYKERVSILPEMTEEDFKNEFLVIITWRIVRELHETDLEVSNVTSDESTTYITIKQKESPNYDSENNILYAVISKEELKDNVKMQIERPKISVPGHKDIEELSADYSIEDAINDGCIVIYNNDLKSKNQSRIEQFIKQTENGESDCIRVYIKEDFEIRKATYIWDVEYRDGFYYGRRKNITNEEEKETYHSYEKIIKEEKGIPGYYWVKRKKDLEEKTYWAKPFILMKFE